MNLEENSQFSQYRIVRLLGQGGMGEVYEAEHTTLGCHYALRLLPVDFAVRSDAVARFWQEAQVLGKLEHPHIVRVDEFGEIEGRYWLRMELVHGVEPEVVSLRDYAAQRSGKIEQGEFALILKQILEGLAHAHSHLVIHGNLGPDNILLEKNAVGALHVKISDFGLARVIGEDSIALPGTRECLTPEQKLGEEADARSDVYAVGLMCYSLLTGKDLSRIAVSELGAEAFWPEFVAKAIKHKPSARYANAQEMLEALKALGGPTGAEVKYPESTATHSQSAQEGKIKQPLALAVSIVALVLVAISCLSLWSWLHPQKSEPLKNLPPAVHFAVDPKTAAGGTSNKPKWAGTIPVNQNTNETAAIGGLLVQTFPSGATVTLDGVEVQASPAMFKGLKAGQHPLRVSLEGYKPVSCEVEVKPNDFTNLATIQLVRKTEPVKIDRTPADPVRYSYVSPPQPTAGDRTAANVEFTQARLAEQSEQLEEALKHYRAAANLDPSWFEAQFNTGVLAHQMRDYPLALSHYELALAIQPGAVDARYNFALALQAAGYAQDAADELKKLLTADPGEVRGHLALANLSAQSLHDNTLARQHYLKVLELDPMNPQASNIRSWLSANAP